MGGIHSDHSMQKIVGLFIKFDFGSEFANQWLTNGITMNTA